LESGNPASLERSMPALTVAKKLQVALREQGLRMTPQRQLIAEAIASVDEPITAERVHQYVARQFPDVNVTTVYRTFETLEVLGLVRHTHVHDGVAHYHLADQPVHQHLVCLGCRAQLELDPAVLEPLANELRGRFGFKVALGHSALVGWCDDCQRQRDSADC
jgi:Fur family ferric uptake transcriptional regulator